MFQRIDHIALTVKYREKPIGFTRSVSGSKSYEHNVPSPVVEKIVYLKLGDTVFELVHMPNGPANQGYLFVLKAIVLKKNING